MDVGVLVQRGVVGRDDGVPDDDFGVGYVLGVVGGVGGGDVGEDLFGVPVEEGGEVGFEVEGDVGVFFAFGAVVVWSAFDSVFWLYQQRSDDDGWWSVCNRQ